MSNYDFDQITDRRNTGSLKWDVAENELPMWVADMDFQTAPAVREAIEKRAAHGVFGYTDVEEDWYQAYMNWWERRHQFSIKKEWLTFCTGVVPAISSTVRKLTTPGENVLIQTPVYNIFFNSIVNNGRNVVECPLAYDGENYEPADRRDHPSGRDRIQDLFWLLPAEPDDRLRGNTGYHHGADLKDHSCSKGKRFPDRTI